MSAAVAEGIARLSDPRYCEDRHKLVTSDMITMRFPTMDRESLQHLVDFLDNHPDSHEVAILLPPIPKAA
jgi:hypothetical protein